MEISVNEMLNLNNPYIIDIRSIQKYNDNHILGAINIPFDLLISNPSRYLNKKNTYYIYCQKGLTSKNACRVLRNLGYNAINIIGGYEAYIISKH